MDRIDGDPLAGSQNPDYPLAGHSAAPLREANRQIPAHAADRNGAVDIFALTWRLEDQADRLVEAEPTAVALSRRGTGGALVLEIGMDRSHDVAGIHLAPPDRDEDLVKRGSGESRQRRLQFRFGEIASRPLECALDDLASEPGVLSAHGVARRAPNGGARLSGHDQ